MILYLVYAKFGNDLPFGFSASKSQKDAISKVFFHYEHDSTKQWLKWILKQDKGVQNLAYDNLRDYLESPPNRWSSFAPEVIECIKSFQRDDTFKVIKHALLELEPMWGRYKIVPGSYKVALEAMIEHNPNFIKECVQGFYKATDDRETWAKSKKQIIIDKVFHKAPENLSIEFLSSIITNPEEDTFNKNYIFSLLNSENESYARDLYRSALSTFIKKSAFDYKAEDKSVFIKLIIGFSNLCKDDLDWDFLLETYFEANQMLKEQILQVLKNTLDNPNLEISDIYLFKLLNIANPELISILGKRQSLSEIEQSIVEEESIPQTYLETKTLGNLSLNSLLKIPNFLEENNEAIVSLLKIKEPSSNLNGILLGGNDELEKLYQVRAAAFQLGYNFIYCNLQTFGMKKSYDFLSAKFNEIQKPYVVYLQSIDPLVKPGDQDQYKVSNFFNMLKNYLTGTQDRLFASVTGNLERNGKDGLISLSLRKTYFPKIMNINKISSEDKQELYHEFLASLGNERKIQTASYEDLLVSFGKDISNLEYYAALQNYFKTSLVVKGSVLSLDEYAQLKADKVYN